MLIEFAMVFILYFLVEVLLQHGADPNVVDQNGNTPFQLGKATHPPVPNVVIFAVYHYPLWYTNIPYELYVS